MKNREDAIAPVGGQAVIEGVMMRSKAGYAIALQKKNGEVTTDWFPYVSIASKKKFLAKPFIRGVIALFSSMIIGIKALLFSAANAEIDEPDAKKKKRSKTKPF